MVYGTEKNVKKHGFNKHIMRNCDKSIKWG